jgi:AcrR family transcriptional regulator
MATTKKRERAPAGAPEAAVDGRTRLLDAARDLFLARGYAAVSIGEITAAAGMTRAAPYYHFKDKEDLFLQVFLREIAQLRADVAAIVRSDLPFRERLERIVVYVLEIKSADTGRLFDDLHRHVDPARRAELMARREAKKDGFGDPFELVAPMFAEAAAAGEIRRVAPEVAATVFLATLAGLAEMTFREKHFLPGAIAPAAVVDVLLHGF